MTKTVRTVFIVTIVTMAVGLFMAKNQTRALEAKLTEISAPTSVPMGQ